MKAVFRPRPISPIVLKQAELAGYTPLQALVLAGRIPEGEADILTQRVSPRLSSMDPPATLPDIERATERVVKAVINNEMVICCTDFDCDGVSSSCVILSAMVEVFGHPRSRIKPVIGLRLRDGYGVSSNVTDRILQEFEGPALMITADQGSSDETRIATLLAHGIETVVTDHHGIPESGPPASAIACVNPTRSDSAFTDRFVAGVHVAFLLMCSVRQRLIDIGVIAPTARTLSYLADFVALGTTADAVSFARSTNNRAIVAHGLNLMNRQDARPAWQALRTHTGKSEPFTTADISYGLSPLVNAAGRIDDAMDGVRYLMSETFDEAQFHLSKLDASNLERRKIEAAMKLKALPIAASAVEAGRSGLVVFMEDGHPGIHGVVCSRVVEAFGRPAACFSPKTDSAEIVTGSLRSIPGVHMRECLAEIHAAHPDIQLGFGGHEGAAGTHLLRGNLDRFADAFDAAVKRRVGSKSLHPYILVDGPLPGHPDLALLPEIAALAPYGREFEQPVFTFDAGVVSARQVGDGSHLQLVLDDGRSGPQKAIWFSAVGPDGRLPVEPGEIHQFAIQLDANTYRQRTTLQLKVLGANPLTN